MGDYCILFVPGAIGITHAIEAGTVLKNDKRRRAQAIDNSIGCLLIIILLIILLTIRLRWIAFGFMILPSFAIGYFLHQLFSRENDTKLWSTMEKRKRYMPSVLKRGIKNQ